MIYGTIYPPRAGLRNGYYPDENKTLKECVAEYAKTQGVTDLTENEYPEFFDMGFFSYGFTLFIKDAAKFTVGTTPEELAKFQDFLEYVSSNVYYDNYDRYVAITDIRKFYHHTWAWGKQNAQKWFSKWKATRTILDPDGKIGSTETINETTAKTGNNSSKVTHDITKKDSETNSGTNSSTATLENSKTDKERSNDFPIYPYNTGLNDPPDQTDEINRYASGSRKLESDGNSTGTTSGTASGTRVLDTTDKGTNDRADTINESETHAFERTTSYTKDDSATLQEIYYTKVQNLAKEIADSYGQFFNGDLLAYQL